MTDTETQNWFEPVSFLYFSVNYKNICLHFTFAILHSCCSVVVSSLRRKTVFTVLVLQAFCSFPTSNMGKTKTDSCETRRSTRLKLKLKDHVPEIKKKAVVKKAAKPKKDKQAENGSPKAEETKAEATEAK